MSCPVALYNARHDRSNIRFNLINPETGNRIRMITQDAETGDEVQRRNLVKGYELMRALVCRLLIALIGAPLAGYVKTPVNTRQYHRLEL